MLDVLSHHQGKRITGRLCAARAADAVHVIFRMLWHIVVHHVAHAGDIETAASDIGGHQHFKFTVAKALQ